MPKYIYFISLIFAFCINANAQQVRLKRTVSDGSSMRSYIVHLPSDYKTRTSKSRVVIGFHPASSSGAGFEKISDLHSQAGADEAIVVYPDGAKNSQGNRAWNVGFCCSGGNDLAFYDAIIDDLKSLSPIKNKVAITGYSSGAMMVYHLLCKRSDEIYAAAPFGAYLREQDLNSKNCTWNKTVPIVHIHGSDDQQMDPDGQNNAYYPNSRIRTLALSDYMKIVADLNGGFIKNISYDLGSGVSWVTQNDNTSYIIIDNLGHSWPGYATRNSKYGPARTDIEASPFVMWVFGI